MNYKIDTIIFDLGGVLVDWKPEYLYRKVFNGNEKKVQWFLSSFDFQRFLTEKEFMK